MIIFSLEFAYGKDKWLFQTKVVGEIVPKINRKKLFSDSSNKYLLAHFYILNERL